MSTETSYPIREDGAVVPVFEIIEYHSDGQVCRRVSLYEVTPTEQNLLVDLMHELRSEQAQTPEP